MDPLIIQCPVCRSRNRVPRQKLDRGPRCGKCNGPLPAFPDHPVAISDETFEKEVLDCPIPVLVDCWASWCAPCRKVAPVLDALAREYAGRVKIAKLNTEENRVVPGRFGIQSIPTLLLFRHGQRVDTLVGALPKDQIAARLRQVL